MFFGEINMSAFDTEKCSTAEIKKKKTTLEVGHVLELTVLEVNEQSMFVEEGIQ